MSALARRCLSLCLFLSSLLLAAGANAASSADNVAGLKEALARGTDFAVAQLGAADGFLGNPKVRIPLPDSLRKVEKALRTFGQGKLADELVTTMNHAAEKAVAEARPVFTDALHNMSIADAAGILRGGDDAATQYFKRTTSTTLTQKFLPVVREATAKTDVAAKYNKFAGKGAEFGLIDKKDADLDGYIAQKALDGLFTMIAEQEKSIRKDPVATGSSLLKKVFGAL